MPIITALGQPTRLRTGLITLAAGGKKSLSEAVWNSGTAAPNLIRGFSIKTRSGSVRVRENDSASEGWTLSGEFADETANTLDGLYVVESTGSAAAIVEIACREGGIQ